MAHRPNGAINSEWPEVDHINSYAALLGCMAMAVRGFGFLVFTWITVVLLGGFVSTLQKKDFWCLTVIAFIQIAGVVDVFVHEKIASVSLGPGMNALANVYLFNRLQQHGSSRLKIYLKAIALFVQTLAFLIVLLGYLLGLRAFWVFITTGIALWRLAQRDYNNNNTNDADPSSKANMISALDVLYTLVVLQGAILLDRTMLKFLRQRMVNEVAQKYGFHGSSSSVELVFEYYMETRIGCDRDPSFANGRNLVTYAVDMMGFHRSPNDYLSGTRILGTILGPFSDRRRRRSSQHKFLEQRRLVKQLIGSAAPSSSSGHILEKLLQILDERRPRDRDLRDYAARIVACLEEAIPEEQFPRVIRCVSSSLIEPFQDWCRRDSYHHEHQEGRILTRHGRQEYYSELLLHGLFILGNLAADEDRCRVMSENHGLLAKVMAPLTSGLLLHEIHQDAWLMVVEESMVVVRRLVENSGAEQLRRRIGRNEEAVGAMERILKCGECKTTLKVSAMEILTLTQLYMDNQGRETFIKLVADIFIDGNSKDSKIREMAGEALAKLSVDSECGAGVILKASDDIVDRLGEILLDIGNETYRISAAKILEHLCIHYTNGNDVCFGRLKKALTNAMPKVFEEILCHGFAEDETHTRTQVDGNHDIENPPIDYQAGLGKSSSSHPQATLLSLCVTVCDRLISEDQDLAHQLDAIAPGNDARSFPRKLNEMVDKMDRQIRPTCVRMLKLTSKMVISMMKHRGGYLKQDLHSLMESLSRASKDMFLIEGSMVFSSGDGGATTTTKPERNLASLLEEANELVRNYKEEELEVMAPSTSVSEEP